MGLQRQRRPLTVYQALDERTPSSFAVATTDRVCDTLDLGGQYKRALAIFIDAADRLSAAHVRTLDERRRARDEYVEARRQLASTLDVDPKVIEAFMLRTV